MGSGGPAAPWQAAVPGCPPPAHASPPHPSQPIWGAAVPWRHHQPPTTGPSPLTKMLSRMMFQGKRLLQMEQGER